jgi:hypothetical protein
VKNAKNGFIGAQLRPNEPIFGKIPLPMGRGTQGDGVVCCVHHFDFEKSTPSPLEEKRGRVILFHVKHNKKPVYAEWPRLKTTSSSGGKTIETASSNVSRETSPWQG